MSDKAPCSTAVNNRLIGMLFEFSFVPWSKTTFETGHNGHNQRMAKVVAIPTRILSGRPNLRKSVKR